MVPLVRVMKACCACKPSLKSDYWALVIVRVLGSDSTLDATDCRTVTRAVESLARKRARADY